ncbi:DUF4248 domain-containing protein [Phocaeicola sp.]
MKEEERFVLRPYYKAELAELYTPGRLPENALKTLYRWMKRNADLCRELEAIHYNKHRHCFLKPEVEIIVKYLGEP